MKQDTASARNLRSIAKKLTFPAIILLFIYLLFPVNNSIQNAQEFSEFPDNAVNLMPPGDLDTTFNGNGKVITNLGSSEDEAKAVAIQADGKIVVVGNGLNGGLPNIAVTRYSSTGVREMSFGGFYPNGGNPELGNAVAIQTDGKIIVAGGGGLARIFRLDLNGQIDLTFADSFADEINAIAIQSDGKFVFAGYSRDSLGPNPNRKLFTVFRYTTAGQRDTTFGTNGRVRFSMSTSNTSDDVATSVKIDSNGNIVVGGYNFNSGGLTTSCAFIRLLGTNGGFDNTFDGDGRRLVSIGSDGFGGDGRVNSIALTTDNKITAAISNTTSFTIARFNTDGAFDNTFDGNGMATANFGVPATAKSLAIQPNGIIIVGASASNDFGLAAFKSNGTLDTSFGTNGTTTANIGSDDVFNAVLIQPDRKIVAVGYTGTFGANADFAVARFLGNNTNLLTVTNTNNSGAGSLRQAIIDANAAPGLINQIGFELTIEPFMISPTTPLPTITVPVLINGANFGGNRIVLNGASSSSGSGLVLAGGNSTLKNLIIYSFPGNGIHIITNGGNLIESCNIGTNGAADTDLGNGLSGIRIETAGNTVGGFTSGFQTAILGNNEHGILIIGSSASGNVVVNSSIGISPVASPAGGTDIGNSFDGISIQSAPNNIIGSTNNNFRNTISGNNRFGILIAESTASGNQVINNEIGSYNFSQDRGNSLSGIRIDKAPNNIIGVTESAGNFIYGNDEHGVLIISDTAAFPASGNTVKGNNIRRNTLDGVSIQTVAPNNIIGGTAAGEGNTIGNNNRYGVFVGGNNGNIIKGNRIGGFGTSTFGNAGNGIFLSSASNTIVGGILPGEKNYIAFNGDAGISLLNGTGNSFRGNSIFQNTGLGIELPPAGVNPNDPGDGDTGSNNLQNYPIITGAASNGNITVISGTLNSNANSNFNLDFYSNYYFSIGTCNAAPPLDYGEGETYLGSGSVTTNASGNATFNFTFSAGVITPQKITATATDANGNTSEFSQCFAPSILRHSPFDFDGDGKTDIGIFRPAPGEWWIYRSSNGTTFATQFGNSADKIVPADYTGDGKADVAVFRPSAGEWLILRSEDLSFYAFPFGVNADVPVPADYDGDGKADAAVFRPSTNTWFIQKSAGGTDIIGFGTAGDKPVVGDYDGDGKADIAIYRPSVGQWWIRRSSDTSVFATTFGVSTDKPVQGFYTADNKTDMAFWRPSTGEWYILRSEDFSFYSFPFGRNADIPVPGDYDGDGKFDAGVFRPSENNWYIQRTMAGTLIQQFGIAGDKPIPNAFVP